MTAVRMPDLAGELRGHLLTPGDNGYDRARLAYISRFDQRPLAVALCVCEQDVQRTLRYCTERDVEFTIRGGGHSFAGYSSGPGIIVDVAGLNGIRCTSDTAVVGAGSRIGAMNEALFARGRMIPTGSCLTVGISGTTLGGGLGIVGRRWGYTLDHLLSATVVLADGEIVRCSDRDETDLFWALRGAGAGNFGVVTEFEFLTRAAPTVTSFHYLFSFENAAALFGAWSEWIATVPDELGSALAFTADDDPDQPPYVELYGGMMSDEATTREFVEQVGRAAASEPTRRFCRSMSYDATWKYWGGELEVILDDEAGQMRRQGQRYTRSDYFDTLPPSSAVEALCRVFPRDRRGGQYRGLEIGHYGGAYGRPSRDSTAFWHRDALISIKHGIMAPSDAGIEERTTARRWVDDSYGTVHPHGTGGVYPNFPDPDLPDYLRAYYGGHVERLIDVKSRYDPTNRFRFEQSIPLRTAG